MSADIPTDTYSIAHSLYEASELNSDENAFFIELCNKRRYVTKNKKIQRKLLLRVLCNPTLNNRTIIIKAIEDRKKGDLEIFDEAVIAIIETQRQLALEERQLAFEAEQNALESQNSALESQNSALESQNSALESR